MLPQNTEDPTSLFCFLSICPSAYCELSDIGQHWQYEEIYSILKRISAGGCIYRIPHYCMSDERAIMQKILPLSIREQQAILISTGLIMKMKMKQTLFRRIFYKNLVFQSQGLLDKGLYGNPQLIGIYKLEDVPDRNNVNNGYLMYVDTQKQFVHMKKSNLNTGIEFGEEFIMRSFEKVHLQELPKN